MFVENTDCSADRKITEASSSRASASEAPDSPIHLVRANLELKRAPGATATLLNNGIERVASSERRSVQGNLAADVKESLKNLAL